MKLRIFIIYSIHFCCLEKDVSLYLNCPKGRCCVCCKIWIAGTAGEDHNSTFCEICKSVFACVRFGYFFNGEGGLDARFEAQVFKGILECEGIHDSCHHADVISCDPVHSRFFTFFATINIAPAENNCDLYTHLTEVFDLSGNLNNGSLINAVAFIAGKGLTT